MEPGADGPDRSDREGCGTNILAPGSITAHDGCTVRRSDVSVAQPNGMANGTHPGARLFWRRNGSGGGTIPALKSPVTMAVTLFSLGMQWSKSEVPGKILRCPDKFRGALGRNFRRIVRPGQKTVALRAPNLARLV